MPLRNPILQIPNSQTTVWDDSMTPANSFRTGGSALSLAQFNGDIYLNRFDIGDTIYTQIQLPHSRKLGTAISPHLHLACNSAIGTSSFNVQVTSETSWGNIGGVFSSTVVSGTGALLICSFAQKGQYSHCLLELPHISPVGAGEGVSSFVNFKITRVAAVTEPISPADSVFILGMDAHFEKDSEGSRLEYTK